MAGAANEPRHTRTFAEVVDAVSDTFRRTRWQATSQPAAPTAGPGKAHQSHAEVTSPTRLPSSRWQSEPWKGTTFPRLDQDEVEALWPGDLPEDTETRVTVAKAVEEMELNWNLDPRLLGQQSEGNRGSATIVALLKRLAADSPALRRKRGTQATAPREQDSQGAGGDGGIAASSKTAEGVAEKPIKSYERHDLMRAIERQDHETILAIRNYNFDLLLDSAPGGHGDAAATPGPSASSSAMMQTPLGYAISLGPKWQGTAIVLTGAMSKFVNSLPDPEEQVQQQEQEQQAQSSTPGARRRRRHFRDELDPRTMARLRKLRGNLKLAVDNSLATDQTSLLASYIQVLFMSEGLSFIHSSVDSLRNSVRNSTDLFACGAADPMSEAREMILHFVNAGLRKNSKRTSTGSGGSSGATASGSLGRGSSVASTSVDVASVQDLIDNAVLDLVLMAVWDLVQFRPRRTNTTEQGGGASAVDDAVEHDETVLCLITQPLPAYFFARDDRVTTQFCQRVQALQRYYLSTPGLSPPTTADWKKARQIEEQLTTSSKAPRRLESAERLQVVQEVLTGRSGLNER
ncbi:unnamed protein product [Parajaminaea phylloscopi]